MWNGKSMFDFDTCSILTPTGTSKVLSVTRKTKATVPKDIKYNCTELRRVASSFIPIWHYQLLPRKMDVVLKWLDKIDFYLNRLSWYIYDERWWLKRFTKRINKRYTNGERIIKADITKHVKKHKKILCEK